MKVTEHNVGRFCLSEDDCISAGISFSAYERGVSDAAKAFASAQAREAELMADNARLREALRAATDTLWHYAPAKNADRAENALAATPEQSLDALIDPYKAMIAELVAALTRYVDMECVDSREDHYIQAKAALAKVRKP